MLARLPCSGVLCLAFVMGLLASGGSAGSGLDAPAVLKAQRFELVDSKGVVIGAWEPKREGVLFRLGSPEGSGTFEICADDRGGAYCTVQNRSTKSSLSAGIDGFGVTYAIARGPNDPKPHNARLRMELGNPPVGVGRDYWFAIYDENGKVILHDSTDANAASPDSPVPPKPDGGK